MFSEISLLILCGFVAMASILLAAPVFPIARIIPSAASCRRRAVAAYAGPGDGLVATLNLHVMAL